MEKALISTVTPVYRGANYLNKLVAEILKLRDLLEEENYPIAMVEAIFVDDGSSDGSSSILAKLESEYPWVRVISLSRNFGQHPATVAGMLHASGDWIVTLDEDLQHPPSAIPALFKRAVESSLDIVYAFPLHRVHKSLFRDGASRLSKRITGLLTGNPSVKYFNSFRLIRGNVARGAASVCGHDIYLDLALGWFSNRVGIYKMQLTDDRFQSTQASGYTLKKLLSHWRKLVISSQVRLLRLGAALGLLSMGSSIVYGLWIIFLKLFGAESVNVIGWPSMMVTTLFSGGLIAFLLTLVIEYLGVILLQVQGKPPYFIVDRSDDAELLSAIRGFDV